MSTTVVPTENTSSTSPVHVIESKEDVSSSFSKKVMQVWGLSEKEMEVSARSAVARTAVAPTDATGASAVSAVTDPSDSEEEMEVSARSAVARTAVAPTDATGASAVSAVTDPSDSEEEKEVFRFRDYVVVSDVSPRLTDEQVRLYPWGTPSYIFKVGTHIRTLVDDNVMCRGRIVDIVNTAVAVEDFVYRINLDNGLTFGRVSHKQLIGSFSLPCP